MLNTVVIWLFALGLASASLPLMAISPGYVPPWPDFAELEASGGCAEIVAAATSPEVIKEWHQEQLDELYACSKAGPMPDGYMHGSVLLAKGGNTDEAIKYVNTLGIPLKSGLIDTLGTLLWHGKRFYRKDRAAINVFGSSIVRFLTFNLAKQEHFPAHVYCGQSILDTRRESLVIDYAFSNTVKISGKTPYDPSIDWMFTGSTEQGKHGLKIRDELRMIRPKFYLGRVYTNMVFVFNVILSADQPVDGKDECFPGYPAKA